jgi:adenine-specific DNA methylase
MDKKRLIEVAFPLKQTSLDSVHEKNVRHGHISTLHIWPARRPLAACRAALIATLLPDPGTPEERKRLIEKIGGTVVQKVERKKIRGKVVEVLREETVGGILHWGRESNPDLEWFRQEIRKAYGGRPPKVLDPFAGGGAIPLEAIRLGCDVTAIDINPVAWFILKCTLEYPQKLAGQFRPLPKFALESPEFMEGYFKTTGKLTRKQLERNLQAVQLGLFPPPDVDLAWHVRAWGWWVLQEPGLILSGSIQQLMASQLWLIYGQNRKCKNCRATIPLLKTRWLCKKEKKRVILTMEPNADKTGVIFDVQTDVPHVGGNAAQRREHDKRIGAGTMSRSGATCPCCNTPSMTMEDIRLEGQAGRLGTMMTAVVMDGPKGKEYRLPTENEIRLALEAEKEVERAFADIPFGLPNEPTPAGGGSGAGRAFSVQGYGIMYWCDLHTSRQLLALGTFVKHTRASREVMRAVNYPPAWIEAISAYLSLTLDKIADYNSMVCTWHNSGEKIGHTYARFALPITWDFVELAVSNQVGGAYDAQLEWIARYVEHGLAASKEGQSPIAKNNSAIGIGGLLYDAIITDPPYYDAIPYSDLMDFFYIWLRRTLNGLSPNFDAAFVASLSPKWDHTQNDGELIDDASRHGGDEQKSKAIYEDGMARVFQACCQSLTADGHLVIVFAHKKPDAWETLVSAIIRAGFVVDGSWPIQTEMGTRMRAMSSAALSSSVWLVCKKRPETARPGWDNRVLDEMRQNIYSRLREYWDAGIRGPDFVWAATGPALESYSKHPVVKKANAPGKVMEVSEFLRAVRRIVVDFVVGRVLTHNGDGTTVSGLDDVTTYYLLHRHDFGMDDAPIGACILYAISCGLSDRALADQYEILIRTGGQSEPEENEDETEVRDSEADVVEGTGSKVKLRPWHQRKHKSMGYDADGRPAPLIDQAHRLMHLWKAGDAVRVDEYLDNKGLRRNALFHQLLQALIELALNGSEERSLLESISNHVAARGAKFESAQATLISESTLEQDSQL